MPSERFIGLRNYELKASLCQRCYFLKYHDVLLNVRTTPEDYISLLSAIRNERALVVVVVDLLDMPCSIWPGLLHIIGKLTFMQNIVVWCLENKIKKENDFSCL